MERGLMVKAGNVSTKTKVLPFVDERAKIMTAYVLEQLMMLLCFR